MSKIVFFCIPAHGHTNPTLGVVRELTARGHQVRYYSYEPFRQAIEAAGAQFISCEQYAPEPPEDAGSRKVVEDLSVAMQVLADTTLALGEPICRALQEDRPDCIVYDSMAVWGKAIARKLDIPSVCSTTTFAFNRYSARIMKQSPGAALKTLLTLPRANRQVRRLQKAGYPFRNALDIMQSDDTTETVVYTSPGFQPCSETFSDHVAFVGPSVRPITQVPETDDCLPLIYVSLGTVLNDAAAFYRSCLEAFRDLPCQAILSVGQTVKLQDLGHIPENCRVYPTVDQIGVLSKANIFVTHCGMNSVSEALSYGVPLVTYPQTTEQLGIARRVEELNAGLRLEGDTPQAIRQAVDRLLQTPSCIRAAQRIARGFRSCPGAAGAADRIEAMCRR